jgi:hypothetical protein
MISATSDCVGFWPRARNRSPSVSRGTLPAPFLSNRANASLYSFETVNHSPLERVRDTVPALSLYEPSTSRQRKLATVRWRTHHALSLDDERGPSPKAKANTNGLSVCMRLTAKCIRNACASEASSL